MTHSPAPPGQPYLPDTSVLPDSEYTWNLSEPVSCSHNGCCAHLSHESPMPQSHFWENIAVASTEAEKAGPPRNPELCSASAIGSSGKQPTHKPSLVSEASYREGNCSKCESAAELGKVISPLLGRLREPFPAQCFSLSASNHS